MTHEYPDLLSGTAPFRGLDRVSLARPAAHAEPMNISAGQMLVRRRDAPDGLYLIHSGRLGIYGRTVRDPREVRLAMCGPGDAVGETAWLSGHERTATIRAESDSAVLRIDKGRFNDLVRIDPTVRHGVSNKLMAHLRVAESAIVRNAPAER